MTAEEMALPRAEEQETTLPRAEELRLILEAMALNTTLEMSGMQRSPRVVKAAPAKLPEEMWRPSQISGSQSVWGQQGWPREGAHVEVVVMPRSMKIECLGIRTVLPQRGISEDS